MNEINDKIRFLEDGTNDKLKTVKKSLAELESKSFGKLVL